MMKKGEMIAAIPRLLSANITETVRFYEAKLGFRCRHRQEGMAILRRDSIELMYTYCPHQDYIDWSCGRIQVHDIEALHAELAHVIPDHPHGQLHTTDYGTREFGIVDCHGAVLTFFQTSA